LLICLGVLYILEWKGHRFIVLVNR